MASVDMMCLPAKGPDAGMGSAVAESPRAPFAFQCACEGKCTAMCVQASAVGMGAELTDAQRRHVRSMQMDGAQDTSEEALTKIRQGNVETLLGQITRHAGKNLSILDVGSGTGDLANHCADRLQAKSLKCYDVVPPEQNAESVAAIATRKQTTEVHLFDGTNLPEDDQSFDIVSAIFVLHHAGPKYQEPLLKDMIRVSKQWVVITEDLNEPEFVERNEMHDINGLFRTHEEWMALWRELDLDVVETDTCNGRGTPQQYYLLRKKSLD